MKIFVCSDTHGRLNAARLLAEAIEREKPDLIVHCGDYMYNGPRNGVPDDYDPMGVSSILNAYAERIIGVRGNCDARIDECLLAFKIDDLKTIKDEGRTIYVCHGDNLDKSFVDPKEGDLLFSGHTHVYLIEDEGGVIHLNPGSIGFPKNGNPATYAIYEGGYIAIKDLVSGDIVKKAKI